MLPPPPVPVLPPLHHEDPATHTTEEYDGYRISPHRLHYPAPTGRPPGRRKGDTSQDPENSYPACCQDSRALSGNSVSKQGEGRRAEGGVPYGVDKEPV